MDRTHLRKLLLLSVLGFLASGLGVGIGLLATSSHQRAQQSVVSTTPPTTSAWFTDPSLPPPTTTGATLMLSGDGLGSALFGQTATVVMSELEPVLGPPTRVTAAGGDCTVDDVVEWSTIDAYFFQGLLVGYDGGSSLNATTAYGLRVGDTVAEAEQLYPSSFHTSYAQGGSWNIMTPTGELAGLLIPNGAVTGPDSQIADISAGSVGCPAVSP